MVQEVVDHLTVSLEPAVEQLRALREGESTGDALIPHVHTLDHVDQIGRILERIRSSE